jgi:hypothetical protein
MNLVDIAILNFYSLLFLLIILHQYVQQADFKTPQKRLIVAMMIMNAAMLVLDVTGRFDGHFHPAAPAINHISNFLYCTFSVRFCRPCGCFTLFSSSAGSFKTRPACSLQLSEFTGWR